MINKFLRLFSLVTLLVCNSLAYGNSEDLEGLFGVVCDGINRVEFLDSYEARSMRFAQFPGASSDVKSKLDVAIAKLNKFSPYGAINLRNQIKTYMKSRQFFDGGLPVMEKPDRIILNETCDLVQIGVQENSSLPGERETKIYSHFWKRMDANSQAALILHAVVSGVLTRADNKTLENPEPVRRYVAQLIGGFPQFNQGEFDLLIERLTSTDRTFAALYFVSLFGSQTVSLPCVVTDEHASNLTFSGCHFTRRIKLPQGWAVNAYGEIENGTISVFGQSVPIARIEYESSNGLYRTIFKIPVQLTLPYVKASMQVSEIEVKDSENGKFIAIKGLEKGVVDISVPGGVVHASTRKLEFVDDRLITLEVVAPSTLRMSGGEITFVRGAMSFHTNGYVKFGYSVNGPVKFEIDGTVVNAQKPGGW